MARKTAVTILEDALSNIKASTWICGSLDACTVNKKGEVKKHMACAVGLVSLAAGGKATRKATFKAPSVVRLDGTGHVVKQSSYPLNSITTYVATYPNTSWSKAAQEATRFLALAIPENRGFNYALVRDASNAINPFSEFNLQTYSSAITDHNDSYVKDFKEARQWFRDALALAKSGR